MAQGPVDRALRQLLWHGDARRYFGLPRTYAQEPNPKGEGPFGRLPGMVLARLDQALGGSHPTPAFYVTVGAALAVITVLELWAFTWNVAQAVVVPLLLLLSFLKFAMVVAFFMHLKFDSRLLTGIFVSGLLLAVAISLSLLALFFKLNG